MIIVIFNLNANYLLIINSQQWEIVCAANRLQTSINLLRIANHMRILTTRIGLRTLLSRKEYISRENGDSLAKKAVRASFYLPANSTTKAIL